MHSRKLPVGLVLNRTKPWTQTSQQALQMLAEWPYPVVAQLRDSQSYVVMTGLGRSLFDYRSAQVREHQADWEPLLSSQALMPASLLLLHPSPWKPAMRELILLRHLPPFPARPTSTARWPAEAAGKWLKENKLLPDCVLCSPSRRRETLEAVMTAIGYVEKRLEDRI